MELTKKDINRYLKENLSHRDNTFRSSYHMEPTLGWMNDPNGLIFFNGEFHLFYQSNPFASHNENMAWGHFISDDLVNYKEVDIALYPDLDREESGCFTGSSFVDGDKFSLIYTRHYENHNLQIENQYLAHSEDGINFIKEEKPNIDIDEIPAIYSRRDFRDPQIIKKDNKYYMFVGSHTLDNKGVILVFEGSNPSKMHYSFVIGPYEEFYIMVECPSYVKVDNKDIFIFSTYGLEKQINSHFINNASFYISGSLDLENKTFVKDGFGSLDLGDAFYAPKIIENYTKPILIGWMENWCKKYPTHELNHRWCGSFNFPRLLSYKNNRLIQSIDDCLTKYLNSSKKIENGEKIKKTSYIKFSFKDDFVLALKQSKGELKLFKKDQHIYLDMNKSLNMHEMIFKSEFVYESGGIEILLDNSSIEVFINQGYETVSSRYYLDERHFILEYSDLNHIEVREVLK